MQVNVQNQITVHELADGEVVRECSISVNSAPIGNQRVELVVDGRKYAVNADALIAAVRNATNTGGC